MKPAEASALYKLGCLKSEDLVAIAEDWLMQDLPAPSISILVGETNPIMREVGPLFEACLKELGVPVPIDENSAIRLALKFYLTQIVEEEVEPFDGMRPILDNIFYRTHFPGSKTYGEIYGLLDMYKWQILYFDSLDRGELYGSLAAHAENEAETHLKEEAKKILDEIGET